MLLPLYVLLTLCTLGSSLLENVCYGAIYSMQGFRYPFNMTVTYTPKVGKPKIVVKNGKAIDPRFRIRWGRADLLDVTEQDNEAILSSETVIFSSVELRVQNCHKPRRGRYGSFISWIIPSAAEYLEFLKYTGSGIPRSVEPQVLWNRTDPSQLRRGQISGSNYEIKNIAQQDSGYYRFRGSKNQLVKWEQIVIEHREESYDFDEGDIRLEFPIILTPSQVKFTREGSYNSQTISEDNDRFKITKGYFEIEDATPKDAGTYDFLDKKGNLMLRASVEIREVEKEWASYVSLAAISFGGILCCCCVKKCCCNESSDKTDEPEDEAPAPTVYHHNPTQSTQTASPLLPRESSVIIPDLPTYNVQGGPMDPPPPYAECVLEPSAPSVPAYFSHPDLLVSEPTASHPDPPQTNDVLLADVITLPLDQVSTTGATEPTNFSSDNLNFTSFNSEPRFEFSGTTSPSAPPLSSEGTTSVEYNSDKLNFLS